MCCLSSALNRKQHHRTGNERSMLTGNWNVQLRTVRPFFLRRFVLLLSFSFDHFDS